MYQPIDISKVVLPAVKLGPLAETRTAWNLATYQYGRATSLLLTSPNFAGCEGAFRNPLLDISQAPAHGTGADADRMGEVPNACHMTVDRSGAQADHLLNLFPPK